MKNFFKCIFCQLAVITALSSCNEKKEIPGPSSDSPEAQQEYLAKVSKEFTEQADLTEAYGTVTEIRDLLSYIPEYYRNFDHSEFIANTIQVYLEGLLSREDKKSYKDTISDNDTIILNNIKVYKEFYKLSNIKGRFTAEIAGQRWTFTKSDYLEFCYPDSAGNNCILSIKSSGKKKQAYILQYKNDPVLTDSTYSYGKKIEIYNDTTVHVYIDIPENMEITLTKNGKSMFEFNVETYLKDSDIQSDIEKSSLKIESYFKTGNTVIRTKFDYSNGNTEFSSSINKSEISLLALNFGTELVFKGQGVIIEPLDKYGTFKIKELNIKPKKIEELAQTDVDGIEFTFTIMNQIDLNVKLKNSAQIMENINWINNCSMYSGNAENYDYIINKIDSATEAVNKNIEEISISYKNGNIGKTFMELTTTNYKTVIDDIEYICFSPTFLLKFSDGTQQYFYQYFNPSIFIDAFQYYSQAKYLFSIL